MEVSSGDNNDTYKDKDKDKVLKRPNVCYIF